MSNTSRSVKENVRQIFLKHCGITNNKPTCMYSGFTNEQVRAAHILPKSSKAPLLRNLHIDDINATRNLLWLAPGIEEAFDAMQLSFIPCLTKGMVQKYKLKIWDDNCKSNLIFKNEATKIGDIDLENQYMDFTIKNGNKKSATQHVFYRRCLAYQAICCHQFYEREVPLNSDDIGDFSSLSEDEIERLNKFLFADSQMIIQKEIMEEEEEEEKEKEETSVAPKKGKFKKHNKMACFKCGEVGHIRRDCPK
jgi:hypothetical protein